MPPAPELVPPLCGFVIKVDDEPPELDAPALLDAPPVAWVVLDVPPFHEPPVARVPAVPPLDSAPSADVPPVFSPLPPLEATPPDCREPPSAPVLSLVVPPALLAMMLPVARVLGEPPMAAAPAEAWPGVLEAELEQAAPANQTPATITNAEARPN